MSRLPIAAPCQDDFVLIDAVVLPASKVAVKNASYGVAGQIFKACVDVKVPVAVSADVGGKNPTPRILIDLGPTGNEIASSVA